MEGAINVDDGGHGSWGGQTGGRTPLSTDSTVSRLMPSISMFAVFQINLVRHASASFRAVNCDESCAISQDYHC